MAPSLRAVVKALRGGQIEGPSAGIADEDGFASQGIASGLVVIVEGSNATTSFARISDTSSDQPLFGRSAGHVVPMGHWILRPGRTNLVTFRGQRFRSRAVTPCKDASPLRTG